MTVPRASQVAHLAAHGVVHRDVKLDNVLLDDAGDEANERVVLTDFGMCFDCLKNRVNDFCVELRYGAPAGKVASGLTVTNAAPLACLLRLLGLDVLTWLPPQSRWLLA
jgi:serine/threonine protein kinase